MDSPLLRVKALIWGHSLIGAGLFAGYFFVMGKDVRLIPGVLVCWLLWIACLYPLAGQASRLTPADRVPAKGLPTWFFWSCAAAQVAGLAAGWSTYEGWLCIAYLVAGIVLIVRESISAALNVPMHRKTWARCMLLAGFGLLHHLVGYFAQIVMSC